MKRIELLDSLFQFNQPLSQILSLLSAFGRVSKSELLILKRQHIAGVLKRYVSDKLSATEVEDWANAIESREDIGYDPSCEDVLGEIIYELANPELTNSLSKAKAKHWIEQLSQTSVASK
ncbi:MAG: hypothetical protein KME19_09440 [Microcoleus vaginatus WJT46-NPBG5]|jgi:hypothetical protein|nr:hypothetical protein [Microcoleus vaginatus WJT46-NPBG5]